MGSDFFFPNRLEVERIAAGFQTPNALADRAGIDPGWYGQLEAGAALPTASELDAIASALGGIPRLRLYQRAYTQGIGIASPDDKEFDSSTVAKPTGDHFDYRTFFAASQDAERLLVARDELTWLETVPKPDRQVDVLVNMSCSTQSSPILLLDTVSVLQALDVSFVAAAGRAACCGKIYWRTGYIDWGERMHRSALARTTAWGAKTHVNWCTACQIQFSGSAARDKLVGAPQPRPREVQILSFLEEQLLALGEHVPWKQEVSYRVLVDPIPNQSLVHDVAAETLVRLLRLVPGVEVLGYTDPPKRGACSWLYELAQQDAHLRGEAPEPIPIAPPERTREVIEAIRIELADQVRARGADTVSCQHQGCHQAWAFYASERLNVRHAVSIIAEALGVANPDRFQAAIKLGDPAKIVEQLRPVWQSWGMTEEQALEQAHAFDPIFADRATVCQCGGGGSCREDLTSIDVVKGAWGA